MKTNPAKVLSLFDFTDTDKECLMKIQPVMKEYAQEVSEKFYDQVLKAPEAKNFISNKKALEERISSLIEWYSNLFAGRYDVKYFNNIKKIGEVHVKIGLDSQFVNAGINYIRNFIMEVVDKEFTEEDDIQQVKKSISKILDLNLNLITKAYQEAELKKVFLSHRFESALVSVAERFTYGLNLVLVAALMGISIGVVGLFIRDVMHIFHGGEDAAHGILSALGSLIIIWVMIELMETEIEHLKGKAFPAIIFVHVVLVSFIREVLVISLQHDVQHQMLMVGTALVLGIIYWLVARAENKPDKDL